MRFSDCAIPDQDIGGRMLSDISYVDIFGDREEEGIEQLIEAALGIVRHDADSPGKYVTARATERPRIIDTVTVAAEWVLWGKGRDDRTYHVLRCSSGEFSPQDFSEVLGRYSPGTLERLPEVAFGWIPDNRTSQNYLAICIYEEGADSHGKIIDLAGRQVMHTRIFCVRYSELAKQHLTYRAMFEGFRGFRLLTGDLEPVRAELAAEPVPPVGGWMHELALNVAALLLTAKPVCILGADMIVLYDRLLFIDIVMSLLPYGLRSAMSAATWVRTRDHKFRLFFAANQGERDLAVSWGRPESRYTDDADAQMYLRWLEAAGPQAAEHTASQYRPMRFDKSEIHEMIARLPLLLNPRTALTPGLEFMSRALRDGDSASLAYYMDTLFGRPHEVFLTATADATER